MGVTPDDEAPPMGSLPSSPRTARGAIVAVDATSPLSRVVLFQYNPDTVTRSLHPRAAPGETQVGPADAHRVWGAPVETVSMKVEVDATDQMERGDPTVGASGIAPQLAALEMLLYPSSYQVIMNANLLQAGTIEILPPEGPLTVLAWGGTRVVPVRLESLTVTEEAFDPALNPIRATVELSAQVLTYNDLQVSDVGYGLFLAHQVLKEAMATSSGTTRAFSTVGSLLGASS
jgi:hypothetical protein